jgi:hypothetical protein
MSHWYRLPKFLPMKDLLARSKERFVLGRETSARLLQYLPDGVPVIGEVGFAQTKSPEQVVKICQQQHYVLVTANPEYASARLFLIQGLRGESFCFRLTKTIKRLQYADFGLAISPSAPPTEQASLVEFVRTNRVLADVRRDPPNSVSICDCRWLRKSK